MFTQTICTFTNIRGINLQEMYFYPKNINHELKKNYVEHEKYIFDITKKRVKGKKGFRDFCLIMLFILKLTPDFMIFKKNLFFKDKNISSMTFDLFIFYC